MKGKLITIEGTDGSGKATQTKLLVERLLKEGKAVKTIEFPRYGQWSAVFVEKYLRGEFGDLKDVDGYKSSLFFALDRYASSLEFKKWLQKGETVVSNRYTSSSMAHLGAFLKTKEEREKFFSWIEKIEHDVLEIPKPDITIFLHVPAAVGQKLVEGKGHRDYIGDKKDLHEKDLTHLKNAEKTYLELAEKYKWLIIECVENGELLSIEAIAEKIWEVVKSRLG